jgi:tRNA-specific 2-thiouridylase
MSNAANSLGIVKPPADTRVVVAMSGGVDSSVTAALMKEAGYDVVGITLQLYDHGQAVGRKGACCAGQDIHDARRVADSLGIAHYVLDYENRFRTEVMAEFADSYLKGETPIPCVLCNQRVKFRDLLQTARDLGADALATGHYVRRVAGGHGPELHCAVDAARDQSYFLFTTTCEQLDFLRFPLGELRKDETRAIAARFNLVVAGKPDSQDICFVPTGGYAAVVDRLRPGAMEPGEIVHVDGRVLGRHDGIVNFTVGQRRGLRLDDSTIEHGAPLFVVRLDAARRRVIVGPRDALAIQQVILRDVNWLDTEPLPKQGRNIMVKLRSTMAAVPATIVRLPDCACVTLAEPQFGVAPGQACVFYEGARVLGGGWIGQTAIAMAA